MLRVKGTLRGLNQKSRKSSIDRKRIRWLRRYYFFVMNFFYGAFIPIEYEIGEDLKLPHGFHGIFISSNAVIGDRVTILHHVTIGSNAQRSDGVFEAPKVGDGAWIGANATLIGRCLIGADAKIGAGVMLANAIVPDGHIIANLSAIDMATGEAPPRNQPQSSSEEK